MSAINYTTVFIFPGVAYDALWTFALALNRTNEMVGSLTREEILNTTQCGGTDEETGVQWEVVSLENFTYSNQLMGCIIRWNLERTDFVGISVSSINLCLLRMRSEVYGSCFVCVCVCRLLQPLNDMKCKQEFLQASSR